MSNEIGFLKPDLEKYKYVLKKLNTKPKKCIFIDDKIIKILKRRMVI
ncbi:MAG: HAD-IA family hydrolase [Promethearchaeota archaeon]